MHCNADQAVFHLNVLRTRACVCVCLSYADVGLFEKEKNMFREWIIALRHNVAIRNASKCDDKYNIQHTNSLNRSLADNFIRIFSALLLIDRWCAADIATRPCSAQLVSVRLPFAKYDGQVIVPFFRFIILEPRVIATILHTNRHKTRNVSVAFGTSSPFVLCLLFSVSIFLWRNRKRCTCTSRSQIEFHSI